MSLKRFTSLFMASLVGASLLLSAGMNGVSSALSKADWHAGNIIDDSLFYNGNDMTVDQIQSFLNNEVPSCDTNGTKPATEFGRSDLTHAQYAALKGWPAPPYVCLRDYQENPTTHANNLSVGGSVSGGMTAAQIIANAAQTYNIGAKVILTTLEKESSGPLITDTWPLPIQYKNPMGYGCPDTAPCDPSYAGFYNQVTNASYQFNIYKAHPTNYRHQPQANNSVLYNPNSGCGSSTVFIEDYATAGLYDYTPYQPNDAALNNLTGSGNSCSAYGNRNFWYYYNQWFGATVNPFAPATNQGMSCPYNLPDGSTCATASTGDFNGDSYGDVAVVSEFPDKLSFNLWIFPGSSSGLSTAPVLQQHFDASNYWNISGIKMTATDLNHDGYSDLVMFASNGYSGITPVEIMGGSQGLTATPVNQGNEQLRPSTGWYWSNLQVVGAGDFNGDGYGDIAAVSIYPNKQSFNLWIFQGSASGFNATPVLQQHFDSDNYWNVSTIKFSVADINHDNYSDLVMFANNGYSGITTVEIMGNAQNLTSTPIAQANPQLRPNTGWYWTNLQIEGTGDFNGDGYPDVAAVSEYPDKQSFNLWIFLGSASGFGSAPTPVLQQHFDASNYWNISGIKMGAADFNHDRYADLIMISTDTYNSVMFTTIAGTQSGLTGTPVTLNGPLTFSPANGWYWSLLR